MGFKKAGDGEYYYFGKSKKESEFFVRVAENRDKNTCGKISLGDRVLYIPKALIGSRVRLKLEVV